MEVDDDKQSISLMALMGKRVYGQGMGVYQKL